MVDLSSYYRPRIRGDWMGANVPFHNDPNREESVTFINGLGVKWARVSLDLAGLLSTSTRAAMCDYIAYITDLGMNVIALCGYSPGDAYAITPGNGKSAPSDSGLDYLARSLRTPFGDLMDAGARVLEMWNEWNFYDLNFVGGDVARLAKLWRSMSAQWRSVGVSKRVGDVLVITGSTAGAEGTASRPYAPDALTALLNAEPNSHHWFDGIGHHPSLFPSDPLDPTKYGQPWNAFSQTDNLYATAAFVGRPDARIWATEMTWPTWGTGALAGEEAEQATRARSDLTKWFEWQDSGQAGPALVYHGMRDNAPGSDTSHGAGIRRADGSQKPVCSVLTELSQLPFPVNFEA